MSTVIRALTYYSLLIMSSMAISILCIIAFMMGWIIDLVLLLAGMLCNYKPYSFRRKFLFILKRIYAIIYIFILKICKVTVHIDAPIYKYRKMIWVANHRSKIDGLLIQSILCYHGLDVISIVKKSIIYIPFIGLLNIFFESILVNRSRNNLQNFKEKIRNATKNNKSILIFPEGATMTPARKRDSIISSGKLGTPIYERTLTPKINGFNAIKDIDYYEHVGDVTIFYSNPELGIDETHSYSDLFKKFPKDIYLKINYYEMGSYNIIDAFVEKNKQLCPETFNDVLWIDNITNIKYSELLSVGN